jgi:hypothetical protein
MEGGRDRDSRMWIRRVQELKPWAECSGNNPLPSRSRNRPQSILRTRTYRCGHVSTILIDSC